MTKATKTTRTTKTTAQGATVTITSTNPAQCSLTNEEIVTLASDIGKGFLTLEGAKDSLNKLVTNARNSGLKLVDLRGKNKNTPDGKRTQLFKSNLTDALIAGGKKASYAQDVFELVAGAIKSGKALTSTNKSANKAGKTSNNKTTKAGKGKGKSTKSSDKPSSFNDLLMAVYSHTSFKTLSEPTRTEIIAKLEKAKLIEA